MPRAKTVTTAQVQEMLTALRAAASKPPPPPLKCSVSEAIKQAQPDIRALRGKGYTWGQIAEIISAKLSIDIKASALSALFAVGNRRPRKPRAASNAVSRSAAQPATPASMSAQRVRELRERS